MSHSSLEPLADANVSTDTESVDLLVRETIAKRLRLELEQIQLDTNFHDLNLDSLDLAELLFLLEDRIKKPINIDQTLSLKTVRDIVILVTRA